MDYKIKTLASTFNNVSNSKMLTVLLNVPNNLLSSLLEIKEFNIIYKSIAPFAYTTCIISGTEWENFFSLRCPKYCIFSENVPMEFKSRKELLNYVRSVEAEGFKNQYDNLTESDWQSINKSSAQPEFQVIAEMLYDLYQEADWKESQYHIPFEDEINRLYEDDIKDYVSTIGGTIKDYEEQEIYIKLKISASMCAKLSYNTQDNKDTLEKHLERVNMLIEHKHQEPFRHQAIAMDEDEYENMFIQSIVIINGKKERKREMGVAYNLRGFISQRYILENFDCEW